MHLIGFLHLIDSGTEMDTGARTRQTPAAMSQTPTIRVDQILNQAVFSRSTYELLCSYFREGGLQQEKEIQYVLPRLLSRAFGSSDTPGWLDSVIQSSTARDDQPSHLFYSFFHPSASLFQTLLRRSHIPTPSFQVSIDCFPKFFQETILKGELMSLPQYFHSKIAFPAQNDIHLQLSPIEYHLFYIGYAWQLLLERRPLSQDLITPASSMYSRLLESYLYYLLPCSLDPAVSLPSWISDSIFTATGIQIRGTSDSKNILAATLSDSILSFLVTLWIVPFTFHVHDRPISFILPLSKTILTVVQHLAIIGSPSRSNDKSTGFMSTLRSKAYQLLQRPIFELVRATFNRTIYEMDQALVGPVVDIWLAWIQPWRIQGKFLALLDPTAISPAPINDQVTEEWLPFIAENLLFYTQILQEYFQMYSRSAASMLFADPRSAPNIDRDLMILYRVVSVFSKTRGLLSCLKECESLLQTRSSLAPSKSMSMSMSKSISMDDLGMSGSLMELDKSSLLTKSGDWNNLIRSGCIQLGMQLVTTAMNASAASSASAGSKISLLFGPGIERVKELVAKLHAAVIMVADEHQNLVGTREKERRGWYSWFRAFLPSALKRVSDELLAQHESRMHTMEYIRDILLEMFCIDLARVTLDGIPLPLVGHGRVLRSLSVYAEPDLVPLPLVEPASKGEASDGALMLSETAKRQIRLGIKKCTNRDMVSHMDIYSLGGGEGLVQSHEVEMLVWVMGWLSDKINMLYHKFVIPFLEGRGYQLPEWAINFHLQLRWFASIPNLVYTVVLVVLLRCLL